MEPKLSPAKVFFRDQRDKLALLFLLFVIGACTIPRTFADYHWSSWWFGDAQNVLAVRNWQAEGFLRHHMLPQFQGPSHLTQHFDEPEFSHHAHGSGHIVDPLPIYVRLYTHYPSFFLLPYLALAKVGIYDKTAYQIFTCLVSLASLAFFYAFLRLYFRPALCLFTVLAYSLLPYYRMYCDSLSGIPLNDFIRFAFLYYWGRTGGETFKQRLGAAAIFFVASMVSIDNFFFLPTWVVLDSIQRKKFHWMLLIYFAVPAGIAYGSQFLQNVWYRGFDWAIWDWKMVFAAGAHGGANAPVITGIVKLDAIMTGLMAQFESGTAGGWPRTVLAAILLRLTVRERISKLWSVIGCLLLSGLGFTLVFPNKALMGYESMQFAPAIALAIGALFFSLLDFKETKRRILITGLAAAVFSVMVYDGAVQVDPKALRSQEMTAILAYADGIEKNFPQEKILLQLQSPFPTLFTDPRRYPQVNPLVEFYADAPVLLFTDPQDLIDDLMKLRAARQRPVDFFVLATPDAMEGMKPILGNLGLDSFPLHALPVNGAFLNGIKPGEHRPRHAEDKHKQSE